MKQKNIVLVVGVVAIVGAAAWYLNAGGAAKPGAKGGGRGQGEQPPTVVNVVAPSRQDVPVTLQANGTVTPINSVDLRPQTTSTIRKVHIKEGQFVKAGELMFSLDDRDEQANVSQAQAQIARDRATLADLERQYKRNQELVAQKFLAQSAIDTLRSQVEAQRALIAANQAALQGERVAASYGSIRAPLSGRVGAIAVYPGSLVQPTTSLTTVTQLDPVNVSFTLPESALSDLLAAQRAGGVTVEAQPARRQAGRRQAELHRQHRRRAGRHHQGQGAVRQPRHRPVARPVRLHPRHAAHPEGRDRDSAGGDHHEHAAAPSCMWSAKARPRKKCRCSACTRSATAPWLPAWPAPKRSSPRASRTRARAARCASPAPRPDGAPRTQGSRAMNISELCIRRPVMVVLLSISLVMVGILAYVNIPVAALPSYNTPVINVSANLSGASPETMASSVALPLEKQFSTIAGIKLITSTSTQGDSNITLEFDPSIDVNAAAVDVQAALLRAQRQLPQEMTDLPSYRKVNPADAPILFMAMTSPSMSLSDLNDYAENLIAPSLSTLPGVAQVTVNGQKRFAVRVRARSDLMNARDLTFDELGAALRTSNSNAPLGVLDGPNQTLTIQGNPQLMNAAQFSEVIVAIRNGEPVRLKDVATVEDSFQSVKAAGSYNGERSIVLMVQRQPNANTVQVVDSVRKLLPGFQAQVPASIKISLVNDRSVSIREAIHDVNLTLAVHRAAGGAGDLPVPAPRRQPPSFRP